MVEADWAVLGDSYARAASAKLVEKLTTGLDAATVQQVLKAAGVASAADLEARLHSGGLAALPGLAVKSDALTIRLGGKEVWSTKLGPAIGDPSLQFLTSDAKAELARLIIPLAQRRGALRKELANLIPAAHLEARIRADVKGDVAKRNLAWSQLLGATPDNATVSLLEGIAAARVGAAATLTLSAAPVAGVPAPSPAPPPDAGANMALSALAAAYPGAGAAVAIFNSAVAFNDAASRLSQLRGRLEANFAAVARTHDLRSEAKVAEQIASKEEEYQQAIADAYQAVFESYDAASDAAAASVQASTRRIALRRALTFYLAERMREEFDLLDASIARWSGSTDAPRDAIARRIRENPQNIRLAVDPEIHLFSFLDRSGEGRRTGIDALLMHWKALELQARKVCDDIQCNTRIIDAQITETRLLGVCSLLSREDRRRARQWSANPKGRLAIRFFFDPALIGHSATPDGEDQYNHRIVNVRIGGLPGKPGVLCDEAQSELRGKLTSLPVSMLVHPGVAYVQANDGRIRRENLLPRRVTGLAPPNGFNIEQLGKRWATMSPREQLEGYGLFTEWQIELAEQDAAVSDIGIRFAYQFNDGTNTSSEADFYRATDRVRQPAPYTIRYEFPGSTREVQDDQGRKSRIKLAPVSGEATRSSSLVVISSINDALIRELQQSYNLLASPPLAPVDNVGGFRIIRKCEPLASFEAQIAGERYERLARNVDNPAAEIRERIARQMLARQQVAIRKEAIKARARLNCPALDVQPEVLVQ